MSYFDLRKYYKNMKKYAREKKIQYYVRIWALSTHGLKVSNHYATNNMVVTNDWITKTKPTPLTEKEIKKFRGEL